MMDVESKKRALLRNFRLEDVDEVPFVVEVGPLHIATKEFYDDDAAELAWHLGEHKARENIDDYGFPNIKPNQGIGIVAAAFGCAYTPNDVSDPAVKAIVNEDNAEEVIPRLAVPDPVTNPVYQHAWRRLEYLQAKSDWPLRVVNVPSPLVTASQIWDYTNFVEATLITPELVHALLEKVTEAVIGYVREQLRRIKNLYSIGHESCIGVPRELGIRMSDDTAAALSPALYREFGVKYNSIVAKEFGGVMLHSCGDVHNVAAAMMEVEGITGLDFTIPQIPEGAGWEAVRRAAAGKTALMLRTHYWDHLEGGSVDLAAYIKKVIDFFGPKGLFITTSMPTQGEAEALALRLRKVCGGRG